MLLVGILSISVFLSQAAFVSALPLPERAAGRAVHQQGHILVHVFFRVVGEEWLHWGRYGFSKPGRKDEGGKRALQTRFIWIKEKGD